MVNNDLGTAHGRIRIDFEDKGTAAALASLQRMQKQFQLLNTRVGKIEKTLGNSTRNVNKQTEAIKKNKSATESWLFTLLGGERIIKTFDKDIVDLTKDLTTLYSKFNEAKQNFDPFLKAFRVLDRYQNLKLNMPVDGLSKSLSRLNFNKLAEGEHKLRSMEKALNSVGWGFSLLWRQMGDVLIGRSSAMQAMPMWTRYANNFSMSLRALGAAGLAAGAALNAGFITKFLNTNLFQRIISQANNAGAAFQRLGAISTKIFGRNPFGNLELNLKNSESLITKWTKNTSHALSGASRGFNAWFKPVAAAARSIQTFTLGIGLMSAGITDIISRFSFLGRIPKPLLVALATTTSVVMPAALQVFNKALIGTSNILMGLLNGVKQLSGGLLALPGALAGIGVVAATLKTIFGGLEDQLKDVFSTDPVEAWEAIAKLPEHLKPMALALREATNKFREMQTAIQKIAFKGVENQIKSLAEKYIPILQTGMTSVTTAIRSSKDEFVKFLEQAQTQKDVNTIFSKTTETLLNLKEAIRPVSDGLRDIATVGTQFFAEWSSGIGTATQRFAEWARANRESGQLLAWMREGKEGARDLVNGTKDLGKSLWNVITMFRSNPGTNFLDRYAASMKKFNAMVKQSRQGGILFDLTGAVKGLGETSDKIEVFQRVFTTFIDLLKQIGPAIQNVSNAFSSIFVPGLESAMNALGNFSQAMTALNIDDFTGIILGLVAAAKLLPTFLKPLWDSLRVILGFGMTLSSASKTLKAFDDGLIKVLGGLEKIPVIGAKAAASILNVRSSLNGILGTIARIAGPVAIIAAVFTTLWAVMRSGRESAKAFDKQLEINTANVGKFGKELTKAFYADKGKVGPTVMDQVSLGMETMLRDLEDTASKAPGIIDHIADYLKPKRVGGVSVNGGFLGESDEINRRQAEGEAAKLAAEKYRELTDQQVDLTMVMTGSQAAFDARIENLRSQGSAGNALADVLVRQRNEYNQVQSAMEAIGPAGIKLAEGLDQIAKAGGDATTKLQGLRNVLEGLGFLKTDQLEAAAEYTTTLGDLADQIRQLKEDNADFSNIWKDDGTLDATNESAAKLIPVLNRVSEAYLRTASASENIADVDAINNRLNETLTQVADSVNRTPEQLKEYFKQNLGAAPIPIKIALQVEGKGDIAEEMANLLLQIQARAEGKDINVPIQVAFDSDEAARTFDQKLEDEVFGGRDLFDSNGHMVTIKAGVQLDEASVLALQQFLTTNYGVQFQGGPVADPAKIPVKPEPVAAPIMPPTVIPPAQAAQPIAPFIGPPQVFTPDQHPLFPAPPSQGITSPWQLPDMPQPVQPSVQMPDLTPQLNEASAKVDEVDGKMQNLVSKDRKIELNIDKVNEAGQKVDELEQKFLTKKLKADIEVNGLDKLQEATTSAQSISDTLAQVFTNFTEQIRRLSEETLVKIGTLSEEVIKVFNNLSVEATNAGTKFVDAFASGLANNPRAIAAARDMAERVMENFHRSPPKKGPLAQHGDAARYGGARFVDSYARGLQDNAPVAGKAAGTVAGAAYGGVNSMGFGGGSQGSQAGEFLGQLLALTNFASSIVGVIQKVSDTVLGAFKFISDPKGEGSFFGKRSYKKTVSDETLQKELYDRQNQAYLNMKESGQRNNADFERRLEIIQNAENGVVEDRGGYKSTETAQTVGAMIKAAFPEIATIGGARPDALPYHREGRALDIMIPDYNTPEGKALGDRINQWALQNAGKLGIDYTIWQDYYQPTALGGGGQGSFQGNQDDNLGHYNHIHLNFAPGASIDMSGIEMTADEQQKQKEDSERQAKKDALEKLQAQYGPPIEEGTLPSLPATQLQWDENTQSFKMVTPHGTQDVPMLGYLNPETKQPYTQEEIDLYKQRNPMEYTLPEGFTKEQMDQAANDPNQFSQKTSEQILKDLATTNADVADALSIRDNPNNLPDIAPERISQLLEGLDNLLEANKSMDTAAGRMQGSALEGLKSSVMGATGFTQAGNPIDTVASIVSQATSVASDVINAVVTGIETVGAVKGISSTLVRGISSTEDIYKNVDNVQKIFELFAGISGAVSSVAGLAGTIVGAAGAGDTSGGTQAAAMAINAIGMVAGFIQAGWEITNAVIDLGQEAYRIIGSYVGDFLGYLVGGAGGPLAGSVKFLLDEQTNQLLTYSADNPFDKRSFDMRGGVENPESRQQLIGNINVYGGPGSDPRDLTRQMMYQVNSAQYAGALAQ